MNIPKQLKSRLIVPHGGYRNLKSYQNAEIIYDGTIRFCDRFVNRCSRTHDQMVKAAWSGKQNIAEGSMASVTSKKFELKRVGVARASLEELLLDYEDFLRQKGLTLWRKTSPRAGAIRALAGVDDRSYKTYRPYIEKNSPETAANTMVFLIHQTNYLLDRQLGHLEARFLKEGGFTERLYRTRRRGRRVWRQVSRWKT